MWYLLAAKPDLRPLAVEITPHLGRDGDGQRDWEEQGEARSLDVITQRRARGADGTDRMIQRARARVRSAVADWAVLLVSQTPLVNTASFVLCVFRRVMEHCNLPRASPLLQKSCVRQVVSVRQVVPLSRRGRRGRRGPWVTRVGQSIVRFTKHGEVRVGVELYFPSLSLYACVCIHIYTYIHTYIHTYMHAYIHTYIHTHIYTCTYLFLSLSLYIYIYVCKHIILYSNIAYRKPPRRWRRQNSAQGVRGASPFRGGSQPLEHPCIHYIHM